MIDFNRNNLDLGPSPYLHQHKENPIHWQEWKMEVLEYARLNNKPIFLSIGYSTCHWCHKMAGETFEDKDTAEYLNENYISIKVDKEQRPDLDGFFMEFISKTRGHGGWPLNVILKPDLTPVYALTYAPAKSRYGRPSLVSILKEVQKMEISYEEEEGSYEEKEKEEFSSEYITEIISSYFDQKYGGFGSEEKFPTHSTLLFILNYYDVKKHKKVLPIIEKTLESIALGGLHDHLQGGFFRYCVDRKWRIPHFEKMLYDQALLLWVFSNAYKVLKKEEYRMVADKVILCLDETFLEGNLYYTAHDADTLHREGDTYVWSWEELTKVLLPEEFKLLCDTYNITHRGNFEGQIHLTRKNFTSLESIEGKLLKIRKSRTQPFVDKKIITSWNALVGVGLVMHWRATGDKKSLEKARSLLKSLLELHYQNAELVHSSLDEGLQRGEFMGDYASLLLLVSYLHEEGGGYINLIKKLQEKILSFKSEKKWIESRNSDFRKVEALPYDSSIPSAISIAELALLRSNVFLRKPQPSMEFSFPLDCDFHNMVSLLARGNLQIIEDEHLTPWEDLSLNTIQVNKKK